MWCHVQALGLHAGRETQGHRFEATTPVVTVDHADSYARQLREQGAVIASFAERRAEIVRQLQAAAAKEGLQPIETRPCSTRSPPWSSAQCADLPVRAGIPGRAAGVPDPDDEGQPEVLPAAGRHGKLTHKFLIVSNIHPADPSAVIGGNERVVRPRLADAKFFFDQDRKKTLASRVPGLAKVVYHGKLGTQGERAERVRHRPCHRQPAAPGHRAFTADDKDDSTCSTARCQAALLAKTDLLTDMVGEFPELQGIMGGYYARPTACATAWPSPSRTTTSPALPATRCRATTPAPCWRWPTSWRPWWACSASASCPPATRTRSRCAAMRWA
jgi:glycyl-tRNA synthetase beta chain